VCSESDGRNQAISGGTSGGITGKEQAGNCVLSLQKAAIFLGFSRVFADNFFERHEMKLRSWVLGMAAALAASAANAADYYANVNAWPVSPDFGFTISAPIDFEGMGAPQDAPDWRWNSSDPGQVLYEIVVPRAIEPQTNFAGATITVGMSSNPKSVANCLAPAGAPPDEKSWKQKIGGSGVFRLPRFRRRHEPLPRDHEFPRGSQRPVLGGRIHDRVDVAGRLSAGIRPQAIRYGARARTDGPHRGDVQVWVNAMKAAQQLSNHPPLGRVEKFEEFFGAGEC
jgi:hypothetical protein